MTVFGQSGGGRKVATLLAMPSAKGLFHRAIIESGATMKLVERDQAARVARELAAALDSASLRCTISKACRSTGSCARTSRPCASMNVDQMTMGFSPTVDGTACRAIRSIRLPRTFPPTCRS